PMPPQISLRSAIKRARLRRLTGLAAKSSAAAARGETHASPPVAIARSAEGVTDLDFAQRLADTGQLAEAARICEAHLRQHGVSARAYYLLGLSAMPPARSPRPRSIIAARFILSRPIT